MIQSKKDYLFYLEADRIALGMKSMKPRFLRDSVWRFERLLRRAEYLTNCGKGPVLKLYKLLIMIRLERLSLKLGFSIPINTFGPGLSIAHYGTVIVNTGARIGSNCRIHADVNIGTQAGYTDEAPQIGNNVYIGPGAKIFGPIRIADNIAIGANSVVNTSFETDGISIGGIPARKISDKGTDGLVIKATEMLASIGD